MKTPMRDKPLAFLDTETTGLDCRMHEVIEIGLVIDPPHPTGGRRHNQFVGCYLQWRTKVAPKRIGDAEQEALEINGYAANPEAWEGAQPFEAIAERLIDCLEGTVIVGANPDFDTGFLREELVRAGVDPERVSKALNRHTVNVAALAYEHLVPLGLSRVRLGAICTFLGVSNKGAHTALVDAHRARSCFYLLDRPPLQRRLYWMAKATVLRRLGRMP